MNKLKPVITKKMQELEKLCLKYNVNTLYVFGSVTRNNFSKTSDIDFLVKFEDIPLLDYADYFFDLMYNLEDLFERKIDLITEKSLTNPYLIKSINQSKQLVYDKRNQKISA